MQIFLYFLFKNTLENKFLAENDAKIHHAPMYTCILIVFYTKLLLKHAYLLKNSDEIMHHLSKYYAPLTFSQQ